VSRRLPVAAVAILAALSVCVWAEGAAQARRSHARTPRIRFDASRAFEHVRQLTAIGPHPSGSPGISEARRYIATQMSSFGLTPIEQAFDAATPLGTVHMVNLIASVPGAGSQRIVIGGHYDTKLYRQFRFVGANDGGSSAAMLIELARALKDRQNAFTLEFVFFDGEEATLPDWSGDDNTYGSRHYVDESKRNGTLTDLRAMLLVDMVGDRDLTIRREDRSTPWLNDAIWASAERLGHRDVFVAQSTNVEDDHLAFLHAGVPSVDLIDLEYPAWHTAEDTLDKVSARSLEAVGDVLIDALPAIEARLKRR
jgi:hypothetical protein